MDDIHPVTGKKTKHILLGVITSAHGIRGEVKLRSFSAVPENITSYGPLKDKSGRIIPLTVIGGTKDMLIARIKGVNTREEAEALRNTELFVPREALPPPQENEYYHEDMTGLVLLTEDGKQYGVITGMHNFGAGDLVAVKRDSQEEEFLPFLRAIFSRIDFDKGVCTVIPPEILADE